MKGKKKLRQTSELPRKPCGVFVETIPNLAAASPRLLKKMRHQQPGERLRDSSAVVLHSSTQGYGILPLWGYLDEKTPQTQMKTQKNKIR